MQPDREYLFIEEVKSYFGFTKFDLIDYLNHDRLDLFSWYSFNEIFGYSQLKNSAKNSIIGSFNYKGIIKINNSLTHQLLILNTPIDVVNFELIQPENISGWHDNKPHSLSYPNIQFLEYTYISDYHKHNVTPLINALDSFERQTYIFNRKNNQVITPHEDFSEDHIMINGFNLTPADLRIKRSQIENIIQQNTKLNKPTSIKTDYLTKEISPIDKVISRLLQNGVTTSNDVMNALKREANLPDDTRLYDPFGILLEVSSDEVIWSDSSGHEKRLSKKSIQNKLSRIKNTSL